MQPVFRRRDDALRFMEHIVFIFHIGHVPSIYGNRVGGGRNLTLTLLLRYTVYSDASLSGHLFDLASRSLAHLR